MAMDISGGSLRDANMGLQRRQEAASETERRMVAFMLQFTPAQQLKVCDVQCIAREASRVAFDEFSSAIGA